MKGFIKVTDAQGYRHILNLSAIKRVDDLWSKCEVITDDSTILVEQEITYIENLIEEATKQL